MKTAPEFTAALRALTWPQAWQTSSVHVARYSLDVADGDRRVLARAWLLLAIAALAASGVFSVLLVVARTPALQAILPARRFLPGRADRPRRLVGPGVVRRFRRARSGARPARTAGFRWRGSRGGWRCVGTIGMCVAPFVNPGAPVMANYVPVIDSGVFLWGLMLFAAGLGLMAVRAMAVPQRVGTFLSPQGALRFGLNAAAIAAAMAVLAFAWSWLTVPRALDARTYYELLFWGPGHVLQFCWSLLLMVAWLWLATIVGARIPLAPRVVVLLFGIGLAAVFITPVIYLAFDVASVEFQKLFTWQMRFGGGLAIVPVGLAVLIGLVRADPLPDAAARPCRAALLASLLLFGAGGLIGFLIQGSDVRVPAHYHGSIVGITLAMMGLSYALLPRLGHATPLPRIAVWQPWLYGGGQLLHIIGLVWSGGYGVQRKVAGAEQVLRTPAEVAGMTLMGAGGLIAIVGGLIFAVVVAMALRRERR